MQNKNQRKAITKFEPNYTLICRPSLNKGMVQHEEETMPNTRKRKNGLLEGRIMKNYKTYSVYARTKTELNKKLNDLKKTLVGSTAPLGKMTVSQYYTRWLHLYKENYIKKSSLDNIKIYFESFILPKFEKMEISKLNQDLIQTFLNQLKRSRTKELIITYFKALVKKAYQEGFIKNNPFDLIVSEKRIKKTRQSFDLVKQEKILNYCKLNFSNEEFELILFYLLTGVRRNEALDFVIEKENELHIMGTKTENADRIIKISKNYFNHLKNIKIPFNFSPEVITKKFKRALNELGIKGCLNCLRHTYATNMFYLGQNIKFVQKQMGHASYQITADVYTNLADEKIEKNDILKLYKNLYYME